MAAKRPAAIDAGLHFGLRHRWYPIFESKDLRTGTPVGIKRLGEELATYIACCRADRLANSDLARALSHRYQHDVHHSDAADQQSNRSNHEHEDENQTADFVPQIQKIIRREKREIIRLAAGKAALAAQ